MVTLHYSKVRTLAICLLVLPSFLFILGWIKLYIALPCAVLLGFAVISSLKTEEKELKIDITSLIIVGFVIAIWLYFSGMGAFFVQKRDNLFRNAMLRDLINCSWPVRYNDASDSALVYYYGHMLFPAVVGKVFKAVAGFNVAWVLSRLVLFAYSFTFIYTTLLLLLFRLNKASRNIIFLVLGIFMVFSGLDYLGQGVPYRSDTHIEYWSYYFQYSSISTQLCWVYNQSLPAWLATSLVLNEKDEKAYALIGLSLVATSPLPLVGLACYMVFKAVIHIVDSIKKNCLNKTIKGILSLSNIIPVVVIVPLFMLYFQINTATSDEPLRITNISERLSQDSNYLYYYLLFVLLEFLAYAIVIFRKKNIKDLVFVVISLLIIPFIELGYKVDFCMRASIPSLFILMVLVIEFFCEENIIKSKLSHKIKIALLTVMLCIGVITPYTEYRTSFYLLKEYGVETLTSLDMYDSLDDLPEDDYARIVYTGVNSSDSFFFKYLARQS